MTDTTSTTNDGNLDNKQLQNKDGDSVDYDALARGIGWKPKEQFRGDPDKWVDAKTYYERGKDYLPIVQHEAASLRAELERVKRSAQEALEVAERARKREVAELEGQLAQAKRARAEALASGDVDQIEAAETALEATSTELAAAKKTSPKQQVDPRWTAWLERNPWYVNDPRLRMMAESLSVDAKTNPRLAPKINQFEVFWDAIGEEVMELDRAMQTFANRDLNRPGPASPRGGPTNDNRGAPKRSYENLLPEYRQACDRQFKDFGVKGDEKKWRERYVLGCTDDAFK